VWNAVSDIDRMVFFETGTVTDIDGNIYKTVKIGTQWWMAENLKTTKYRNGSSITHCWAYGNDENNVETYGRLYNWAAVNDCGGLAPAGWHVATDAEWETLVSYLGGYLVAGIKLKSTSGWNTNTGTDEVGFGALPGGTRENFNFQYKGERALFWSSGLSVPLSSDYAWSRTAYGDTDRINRNFDVLHDGLSVRCVKDVTP
jgi:uncharacterized protein (TIGR02145 family)